MYARNSVLGEDTLPEVLENHSKEGAAMNIVLGLYPLGFDIPDAIKEGMQSIQIPSFFTRL